MSRCFPFSPGYEKKARTYDVDVLKKARGKWLITEVQRHVLLETMNHSRQNEKQREKKHKKDKKDKEKSEREKSEKDRNDGKQREKKDKKEKNRDKKKDKEKDTDKVKDKLGTSDGTRIPGKTENHVAVKLFHKDDRDKRDASQVGGCQPEKLGQNSHLPAENRNTVSVEVARKTKDDAREVGNQLVEKITGSDRKKDVGMEKLGQNSHLPAENRKSVSVEVSRKTKDDEGMVRFVAKGTGISAEVKEPSKDKRADIRKPDVQEVRVPTWVSGGAVVQNHSTMVQSKVPGLPKTLEKNVERKTDGKEKTKEKEGDDKRGEKRKDKDREKKSQGKDKDRDKEKKEEKAKKKNASKTADDKDKKKEDKANEKNGSKHAEPEKSKETNKEVLIDPQYSKPSQLPKDNYKAADAEGNLKKRTNGVFHANEIRPNKLLRPSSSSHPLTENGRTVEPWQTSTPYVSDKQGGANSVKVDSKERKKNGVIEARSSSVSPAKPTSTAAQADPFAEASMRPPHPDSRYLSEIYMVSKMEELSDDDQDWLFGCSDTNSKKPKVASPDEETAQVWSEALRIESADICALPYVIPY